MLHFLFLLDTWKVVTLRHTTSVYCSVIYLLCILRMRSDFFKKSVPNFVDQNYCILSTYIRRTQQVAIIVQKSTGMLFITEENASIFNKCTRIQILQWQQQLSYLKNILLWVVSVVYVTLSI